MKNKIPYERPELIDLRATSAQGEQHYECALGANYGAGACSGGSCENDSKCYDGFYATGCTTGNSACNACMHCCGTGNSVNSKTSGYMATCTCVGPGSTAGIYCSSGTAAKGQSSGSCISGASVGSC